MSSFLVVAGARPNFMKVAPILRELDRREAAAAELVHTGQHYDYGMSGVFFEQLGIREPSVHLQIGSASHGVQTGRIMAAFDEYLDVRPQPPRAIVVVGDVNSTLACALVGVKRGIPVVHVEAGLRSFDRTMPEEINRIVADSVADLLLVSEPAGLDNLAHEGVPAARIKYVGNVMIDALVQQLPAARALMMSDRLGLAAGEYVVATLHRPSNVDTRERLEAVVRFVRKVSARLPVVFPLHPRTEKQLRDSCLYDQLQSDGVLLSPPLGYREFIGAVAAARLVVTDSGGVQEETTYLGIPCVTLRTTTERPITVSQGTNTLAGEDLAVAEDVINSILAGGVTRGEHIDGWDGRAAGRVVDALLARW